MGRTYSVEEIRGRVARTLESGRPVIGASASSGLVAKAAEAGGADFIVLYSTGLSRVMGQETRIIGDANDVTHAMHDEVWAVLEDTPIIVGLDANDPYNWDLEKLLKRFQSIGISGIIHNPMIGIYGPVYAAERNAIGHGFEREVRLTEIARDLGLYCMAYTWTAEETVRLVEAGTHCIIAHVGGTGGGLEPIPHKTAEETLPVITEILDAARSVDPDVLVLAHGASFTDPESARDIFRYTQAQGYIGASSIERTPVEAAVMETVRSFKGVPLRRQP